LWPANETTAECFAERKDNYDYAIRAKRIPHHIGCSKAVIKDATAAYVYLYPLVTFGLFFEVLTNVEKPTWETLSAPLNQFMSMIHES
jgi:hypothetical protein